MCLFSCVYCFGDLTIVCGLVSVVCLVCYLVCLGLLFLLGFVAYCSLVLGVWVFDFAMILCLLIVLDLCISFVLFYLFECFGVMC